MAGVPGILKYTYKAISQGNATIEGIYGRPWDKNSKSTPKYKLTVRVN